MVASGSNTIGGTTGSGGANTIDFNATAGVSISGAAASANVLIGNSIDDNDVGVVVTAASNTIGGTAAGEANTIDSNATAGVSISGAAASANVLIGNSIDDNDVGVVLDRARQHGGRHQLRRGEFPLRQRDGRGPDLGLDRDG